MAWINSFEKDIKINENAAQYILSIINTQPIDIKSNPVMKNLAESIGKMVSYFHIKF